MRFVFDVFAQETMQGLQDIYAPVYFAPNYWLFLFIIAMAALAAFVLRRYFLKRIVKNAKEDQEPRLPAHVMAYQALEALETQNLITARRFKEYYIILSDIVRRYLEARFDIHAPEMTTEEFLSALRQSETLAAQHKQILSSFLSACDLVKFAKYGPTSQEAEQSFLIARKLIDETKQGEGVIANHD